MSRDPNDQPPGGDPVAGDEPREPDELDERYRTLVEQDLVGISLVQDAAFVYVNPRLAEIHGYEPDELLEVDPFELVPEERRDEVLSGVYRLVDGEIDEATVSGPVCRKDGGTSHVEAFLRRTEYRGEEAFLSVTVDVTERVEAERAREASEGLFRAVFENAMEGVVIADDEGAFVDANPAACEIFGLERDRLLGRSIDEFGDVELDFDGAGGLFGESGADRSRFTLVREDGERRIVEYAARSDIRPNRHLSMLRDVTDRVRQEEALEVERERLDFLNAMLRHHVLNGMNVVIATAERLAAGAEGKRRRRLETIHRRGTAIVDLVGTIRSLVRTIQRGGASGFGPVDLDATLRRSIEAVEAEHEDATVTVDGIDADLAVSADAMLETVFEDLIENAIRHNDRPDPEVRVLVEADGGTVSVHVEDDGPGIPDSVRHDVFDDGMTGERSGFGLHVVHLLVTLYDGSLSISDRDPRGTVVTVTLPRAHPTDG